MNNTVKAILIWVLILVAAVGVYNFVEGRGPQVLTLTEFLNHVERGNVADVVFNGSNLTGHLKVSDEAFRSVVPAGHPALYEKLTAMQVPVTIMPSTTAWAFETPSILVLTSLLSSAISIVVLVLVLDLSRFVKRAREG